MSTILSAMLSNLWLFLLNALIIALFKSQWMKGKVGEAIVHTSNKFSFDEGIYMPIKDITLQLLDGSTTQIDQCSALQ